MYPIQIITPPPPKKKKKKKTEVKLPSFIT
jgi:hypothetical protein